MLKYKHFKEEHPSMFFRQIGMKALTIKVEAVADVLKMRIMVYSGVSGDFLTDLVLDREIRVSAGKVAILNELVKINNCSPQTAIRFVSPDENNGSKKMTTILNFKDQLKKAAQPLKRGIPELFEAAKKKQKSH